jgi:uncharacterized protein (TIGR02217 family)
MFHNVRLSVDVERGAQGGPRFKTTLFSLSSGAEKRNIDWERVKSAWELGFGVTNRVEFQAIIEFFYAREGMAHSFRFKDWSDYTIAQQVIGATDGSTTDFQLYKRYSSGGIDYDRVIEKPLASGVQAWVNGLAQTVVYDTAPTAIEVSITTLTGVVVLGATHAATSGLDIEIAGDFDVPVRFDTDQLDTNMLFFDAGSIPNFPIVEVRDE